MTKQDLVELIDGQIRMGKSFDAAATFLARAMGQIPGVPELIDELRHEREQRLNTFNARANSEVVNGRDENDGTGWYDDSAATGPVWEQVKERMLTGSLKDAAHTIDRESGFIVSSLANPNVHGSKARGLVVGYVQAGKTANYTAVIAKAVDAGYRLIIILAGMHNNLRQQTQERLNRDLFSTVAPGPRWHALTGDNRDIGPELSESLTVLDSRDFRVTAVVKKNSSRLANLENFLKDAKDRGILTKTPVLIIDDESDQATPNTEARAERLSGINNRLRKLWELVETGSYVAYTATPFANVFMDPDDSKELYPADFVFPLDRPAGYFGAEKIFGLSAEFIDDDAQDTQEAPGRIRYVPQEDLNIIVPESPQAQARSQEYYDPEMVPSLTAAVQWFILASAVRRYRGQQSEHSSMLVHTGAWKDSHFELQAVLRDYLEGLGIALAAGDDRTMRSLFSEEISRIADESGPAPTWDELRPHLGPVLEDLEVLADNGDSDYRVSYPDQNSPDYRPKTVIVVGGNTLARGLTLEGLVCSYFVRRASSYDTLLQMGRWFGFRPGYADLVRIWTSPELAENYAFLAGVEDELRHKIRQMAEAGDKPQDVGVAVRTHPGRLEITASNKMVLTDTVTLSLGGHRHQTTRFDEHNGPVLRRNQEAARDLVRNVIAEAHEPIQDSQTGSVLLTGVPSHLISGFLAEYSVSPEHLSLQPAKTAAWVKNHADRDWNVVLRATGRPDDGLGRKFEYAPGMSVPLLHRAPLKASGSKESADLRTLMPGNDVLIDLKILERASDRDNTENATRSTLEDQLLLRQQRGDVPMLVLYAIDKDSPADRFGRVSGSRRDMNADEHIIGMGLVLPDVGTADVEYVAVTPTLSTEDIDDVPELDTEADFVPEQAEG